MLRFTYTIVYAKLYEKRGYIMRKKVELKIFEKEGEQNNWELEKETVLEPLWDLEHGENKQQSAMVFKSESMADYDIIGANSLTYNEILSVTELANVLSEFYDVCAAAIVKHAAPCGVALGSTIEDAYNKAFDCDPIASFFGIIGSSQKIDFEVAKHINSMSVNLVFAPDFDAEALALLKENPRIKLVKLNTPLKDFKALTQKDIHVTPFGTICQDGNNSSLVKDSFRIVSKRKPTKEEIEDCVFAWKVSKYSRSNSIVVAKDFKTCAIAQGHISPITAVEDAMDWACDNSKDAVMVSDNTLPTIDCIQAAAQGRISMILQPGGSVNDDKIIELADRYNIAMVFTGIKNYKH